MPPPWWLRLTVALLVTIFCLRCWALEVGRWAFSVALTTIASATLAPIFALMLGIALGRRRFIDPRRQHFQVDQFVEFDWGVGHESSLPQAKNKTSALSNLVAQFWPILLLAVRQWVG